MKSDYFRNFTDLHPSQASEPTETFFFELSIVILRFLQSLYLQSTIFQFVLIETVEKNDFVILLRVNKMKI